MTTSLTFLTSFVAGKNLPANHFSFSNSQNNNQNNQLRWAGIAWRKTA